MTFSIYQRFYESVKERLDGSTYMTIIDEYQNTAEERLAAIKTSLHPKTFLMEIGHEKQLGDSKQSDTLDRAEPNGRHQQDRA